MIKKPLLFLEYWFVARSVSERRSFFLLVFLGLPALFYLLVWHPLTQYTDYLRNELNDAKTRYVQWTAQIEALKKISTDPRVQEWKQQQEKLAKGEKNLKNALSGSTYFLNEELLSLFFQQQNSILLEKVNYNKTPQAAPFDYSIPIEVRLLSLDLSGEYFDFIHYLERLENAWPTLKINSLNYQVMDYPRANIQLELAVLYAKDAK